MFFYFAVEILCLLLYWFPAESSVTRCYTRLNQSCFLVTNKNFLTFTFLFFSQGWAVIYVDVVIKLRFSVSQANTILVLKGSMQLVRSWWV